jgi:hypothetical protein
MTIIPAPIRVNELGSGTEFPTEFPIPSLK